MLRQITYKYNIHTSTVRCPVQGTGTSRSGPGLNVCWLIKDRLRCGYKAQLLPPVADTGIRQWGGGGGGGAVILEGRHIFERALLPPPPPPPPPPTVPLPSTSHWVWNSGARHKLTFHSSMHAIHNLIIIIFNTPHTHDFMKYDRQQLIQ